MSYSRLFFRLPSTVGSSIWILVDLSFVTFFTYEDLSEFFFFVWGFFSILDERLRVLFDCFGVDVC